jgi:hypothetical protein
VLSFVLSLDVVLAHLILSVSDIVVSVFYVFLPIGFWLLGVEFVVIFPRSRAVFDVAEENFRQNAEFLDVELSGT